MPNRSMLAAAVAAGLIAAPAAAQMPGQVCGSRPEILRQLAAGYRVPGREIVEVIRTGTGAWTVTRTPNHMVGEIIPWTSNTLPAGGWAWCNGQALSRTDCAGLFAITSTTFGSGNGTTTFNVPDLRGRVIAGKDDMGGASGANRLTSASNGFGTSAATLGAASGSESHTLTTTEMPSHQHQQVSTPQTGGATHVNGTGGGIVAGIGHGSDVSANPGSAMLTLSAGSGGAHKNVQPTIIANFIVKT